MKIVFFQNHWSLVDCNAINVVGELLQEFLVSKFSDYESCFNQDLYDTITEITILQSYNIKCVETTSIR